MLENHVFGIGKPARGVEDTFGDFTAIARRDYGLYASKELVKADTFKGHHGGGTIEERLIDISIFCDGK